MVEVRGHLVGVGSPLLPCGSQGSKAGCQALQQAPLPAEPSLWPHSNQLQIGQWIELLVRTEASQTPRDVLW